MFENIHWSVYSKASSKQKAMKVFSELEMSLGTKGSTSIHSFLLHP